MKGIILAGGSGSRLSPLTKVTNKHLLAVYNKPMVFYPLNTIIKAGITDIMIVSGKWHAGHILELLGDGSEFGVNISYAIQEKAGGIAQALGLCKRFAKGYNIAVILGDNIYEDKFDFSNFREGARIHLKKVDNPERFGVVKFDMKTILVDDIREREEWTLREIIEKPDITNVDNGLIDRNGFGYAVTGLYVYDNTVFDKINCLIPSRRGELEITDVNMAYLKERKLEYEIVAGTWIDAGSSFEDLYRASKFIRDKEMNK